MTTTEDSQPTTGGAYEKKSHAFQADVGRLLHLMVHSIYSERDIFLRELVSNAADACEKLRYESIADPSLTADGESFVITLTVDKDATVLTVEDNGIGMDHAELVDALGTIASSGTRAFLNKIPREEADAETEREEDGGKPQAIADLIGQFGIGFYSAFMVADQVTVESRRAGAQQAWTWSSDGKGTYTIALLALDCAPRRGTRVRLYLKEASKQYLETWRLETIIREHSGAIAVPIDLRDSPSAEPKRISDGGALWAKPKNLVTQHDYKKFYQSFSGQFDDPALTMHWRVEGRHEYTVLAFVPGSRPPDLFDPERKARTKLYVRRVLISQDSDLLPGWLRFIRLVVDSADLPLNVSREMIQESPIYSAIKRGVTNRILQDITKFSENDPDSFARMWENFGSVIKEGLYEDPERRDQLFKIARFTSTKSSNLKQSLANYVGNLRPNQTSIYYLTGDDPKRISTSPQLEGFAARGIDVLLLSDPVDAFWVSTSVGYDGKPFKSVTQGSADLKAIPFSEEPGNQPPCDATAPEIATLLAYLKQTLSETVSDVRRSERLSESPVCLVAAEGGPDRRLERMLAGHGRLPSASKPILEVNPAHPLVAALSKCLIENVDKSIVEDAAWLLFDEARIMDGDPPADAASFAARLTRILSRAMK